MPARRHCFCAGAGKQRLAGNTLLLRRLPAAQKRPADHAEKTGRGTAHHDILWKPCTPAKNTGRPGNLFWRWKIVLSQQGTQQNVWRKQARHTAKRCGIFCFQNSQRGNSDCSWRKKRLMNRNTGELTPYYSLLAVIILFVCALTVSATFLLWCVM